VKLAGKRPRKLASNQREQAYLGLRRMLTLQQVPLGARLREPEWAQRLGVNRSALREAFARLEAEGWIERGGRTGYFVPRFDADDIAEIAKLRLTLECLAVDEICAAARIDRAALDDMERACAEFATFVKSGYSLGAIEADRRFHEFLVNAPGLRRLADLYRRAPLPMIHQSTSEQSVWEQACTRTLAEHRAILAALRKRDAATAKDVLRRHLGNGPFLPICH
jgi:DNA-binding GntR family transcriptional regulator